MNEQHRSPGKRAAGPQGSVKVKVEDGISDSYHDTEGNDIKVKVEDGISDRYHGVEEQETEAEACAGQAQQPALPFLTLKVPERIRLMLLHVDLNHDLLNKAL
jgi:hypothetical protein